MSERAQDAQDADATIALPTPGRRRAGFAPALERQAAAADLTALGGLNPLIGAANPLLTAVPQIRHALRHPDPAGLRARLREQLGAFERGARAAGVPEERLQNASYALCALLDDSASATPWGRDWARQGLLAEVHHEETGAEGFFTRLDALLATPRLHAELLEFFYVCLALGFEGRYRSGEGGRQALAQIRTRVFEALGKEQPQGPAELSARWRGAQLPARRVPGGLALWSAASVCLLALAGLYFAYSVSLGAFSDPAARDLARLRLAPLSSAEQRPVAAATSARSRELARAIGLPEVEVSEAGGGLLIVLKADELFASGSARLQVRLEPVIRRVAEILDRVPGAIVVTGHTDDRPIRSARFPSNWELSAERARSVVALMRSRIHDAARLRAEGLADSEPIAPNDSAANRAKNRRVTILLRGAS
jgi:type VI secretion system protein ImpK